MIPMKKAADFFEELALGQLFADNDAINGAVLFVKFDDDVENDLVVGLEEGVAEIKAFGQAE